MSSPAIRIPICRSRWKSIISASRPTAYFVPVSVKIPGSVIALADKGDGGETQFDFVGQVSDERKHVVGNVRDYIKIKLRRRKPRSWPRRISSTTPDSRWNPAAIT